MSRFENNFILWFSIFSLVFVGIVIDRIFIGLDILAIISFISSITTVLGFFLALNAYWYWRHKDTRSEQAKLIREILMDLAELEMNLEISMGSAILHEMDNPETSYPCSIQRTRLRRVKSLSENINLLILKFNSIEPTPHYSIINTAQNIHFNSLEQYLFKVGCLLRYTENENILLCKQGVIRSSIPDEANFNVNIMFDGADSFVQLSLFFSAATRKVANDLRIYLK